MGGVELCCCSLFKIRNRSKSGSNSWIEMPHLDYSLDCCCLGSNFRAFEEEGEGRRTTTTSAETATSFWASAPFFCRLFVLCQSMTDFSPGRRTRPIRCLSLFFFFQTCRQDRKRCGGVEFICRFFFFHLNSPQPLRRHVNKVNLEPGLPLWWSQTGLLRIDP